MYWIRSGAAERANIRSNNNTFKLGQLLMLCPDTGTSESPAKRFACLNPFSNHAHVW